MIVKCGLSHVDDGQAVRVFHEGRWTPVVVACAAGHMARVVNEVRGINRWVRVGSLRPDEDGERA